MTERDQSIIAAFLGGQTMASLGRHFGISRERVRQILVREKVPLSPRSYRLGFQAFDGEDTRYRYGWSRAGVVWWRSHHRHKATRREHLAKVRAYVAATGITDPSWDTLLEIVGVNSIPRFAQIWGMRQHCGQPYRTTISRFRKLAGITARPIGRRGHATP